MKNGQFAMLDFSMKLSPGREPLLNVGNLKEKSYHRNYPL